MTQYEYTTASENLDLAGLPQKAAREGGKLVEVLNDFGENGWELVSLLQNPPTMYFAVFKKIKEPSDSGD